MSYISFSEAVTSKCPMIQGTLTYLRDFLGQSHPSLEGAGHKGTVCPFTPQVLENETVSFGKMHINVNCDIVNLISSIQRSLQTDLWAFLGSIEPKVPENKRHLACLLVVVEGVTTAEECRRFVSDVQKEMQPTFVERGLLLSELHPHSQVPSARNDEFFPSRPPFPIFFIRRVIPNDIPYLLRKDRYSDEVYGKLLRSLVHDLGLDVIVAEMRRLRKQLDISLLYPSDKFHQCRGGWCWCNYGG